MLRQLVGQDRDEDQVVDAEHHFHHDEGRKGDPGGGVGRQAKAKSMFSYPNELGRICRFSEPISKGLPAA